MATINDKTTIPIFAVAIAIPALVVTVIYISGTRSIAEGAEKKNGEQDDRISRQSVLLKEINERTIRIEERLIRQRR